jgi:hypothetical protein
VASDHSTNSRLLLEPTACGELTLLQR